MPVPVKILMNFASADEAATARSHLLSPESGFVEAPVSPSSDAQWNADPGTWLSVTAIVVSSVSAAESLFNLSAMFRKRDPAGEQPVALTLTIDGSSYRVDKLNTTEIERLLPDDVA